MPTRRSSVLVSKSGCTSIRRRPAAPRPAHKSVRAASAISWRPTPRRSWSTGSTLSLPTPLFQMAIQSAEAQTSTLAKLAPPHTAAHKLSHQLLNLRSCWALTTPFLRSSEHFNTDSACRTGVLVRVGQRWSVLVRRLRISPDGRLRLLSEKMLLFLKIEIAEWACFSRRRCLRGL